MTKDQFNKYVREVARTLFVEQMKVWPKVDTPHIAQRCLTQAKLLAYAIRQDEENR